MMDSMIQDIDRAAAVRKTAKIWTGVVVAIAVIWIIIELVFPHPDPEVKGPLQLMDWILIALFPVLTFTGMLLAFRWELWGSLLTLVSTVAFIAVLVSQDRLNNMPVMVAMILLAVLPAVLFLWSWKLDRRREALVG